MKRLNEIWVVFVVAAMLQACAMGSTPQGETFPELARYRKVMIEPVSVELDERWGYTRTGTRLSLGEDDARRVKEWVAEVFDRSFGEELAEGGKLEIVDRAGPGVARIRPRLTEVYLNAPLPEDHTGVILVRTVGNLQIEAKFEDSVSGETLLELRDKVRGRDIGMLRTASSAYNRTELRRVFEDWARIIREDIFLAR